MTDLLVDFRCAWRQLNRRRGLTMVALASLALGISVTTAIVSVAGAVLIKPLPYDRPNELVMMWSGTAEPSVLEPFQDPRRRGRNTFSPWVTLQWRERNLPFVDFAVFESWQSNIAPRVDLIDSTGVERLRGTIATANVFSVLGVHAALGRTFGENDTGVVVLSDNLWRRRFHADPHIVGKTITLATGRERERGVFEIIGVLPKGLHFDYPEETEIWLPLPWRAVSSAIQNAALYGGVARLSEGTTLSTAEASLQISEPAAYRRLRFWIEPVHENTVGRSRPALMLVGALALLVLLSGAINAATVFTAAAVSRTREMRTRRALGASRGQLVRQIVVEVGATAVFAGIAGLATLALALPALRAMLPAGMPGIDDIRLDGSTLAIAFAAIAIVTLLAGFAPAWLNVRDRSHSWVEDTGTATMSGAGLRLRIALLGVQFSLVTALLIAGGTLVRSFWNITQIDKGFDVDSSIYVADVQRIHRWYWDPTRERELLRRIRELRYVEAASVTSSIPMRGVDYTRNFGRADGQRITTGYRTVEPAYFEVLRIPLVAGRWLTESDGPGSQAVALVSESYARAMYPDADAVGQRLGADSGIRIVGVVADIRARSLLERPLPAVYLPRTQEASEFFCLLVRTPVAPQQLSADLRAIVEDLYPEQPVERVARLVEIIDDTVADRRAYAVIAGAFAVSMLLLSVLGLCGHLSHAVSERLRDLAIRSALGASPRQQVQLLMRHVGLALIGGVTTATLVVYLSFPLLAPVVFGIGRLDVVSWALSALVVTACTAISMSVPSRSLSRLQLATLLRRN